MNKRQPRLMWLLLVLIAFEASAHGADGPIEIRTPMAPPAWALLERELLQANARGLRGFFDRYFDDRGYLECVERWGGDDGPDDAIENLNDWPILHALGGPDSILPAVQEGLGGAPPAVHRGARRRRSPFARDGMYYKEFPVMFDWLHNGEGLTVFNLQGLSDPHDAGFQPRVRRFAGFYMNEDPGAANYDPEHKIIRSLFNGSRGPLLRKATGLDWAGDPIEVENRFRPRPRRAQLRADARPLQGLQRHRRRPSPEPQRHHAGPERLHADARTEVQGLAARIRRRLAASAIADNGGIIPTNIGLDGTIGGAAGGKWYGGVYGWGFTVIDPVTGQARPTATRTHLGLIGFGNAYLLTGDDRYLDAWRKQIDAINAQAKIVDGRTLYPHMYGDQGLVRLPAGAVRHGGRRALVLVDEGPRTAAACPRDGWLAFLEGKDPGYPEQALRRLRPILPARSRRCARTRPRPTPGWPTTRWQQPGDRRRAAPSHAWAGSPPATGGPSCTAASATSTRRPAARAAAGRRRPRRGDDGRLDHAPPGQPRQTARRTVIVQAGGYGEHACDSVTLDGREVPVGSTSFSVRLAPGAGSRLVLKIRRYVNAPTLMPPWDR